MSPRVTCRHCNGSGKCDMPPAYARTYSLVTSVWHSTAEILALHPRGTGTTALSNRLAWLKREGFVESRTNERNHRVLEWRRL